ncbi:hypothetical protein [Xenorhabdus nematophila]|uniref:hypothetical protein n=1 Tax=Xenorhabdus nematophila TaxID=628 RepID=UPI000DEA59DF|nr:hypothetical protein [Xenorhabdus nematophila]AYA42015.1 hypothetical protein D3790_17590 [Xenorhabdus nematophila]MCB4425425.1 hypothetical protein [Xenorhabdus nematophila]
MPRPIIAFFHPVEHIFFIVLIHVNTCKEAQKNNIINELCWIIDSHNSIETIMLRAYPIKRHSREIKRPDGIAS